MTYLGPFVLQLLSQKRWKRKDLAEKAKINESTLSRYLSGDRTPPEQEIQRIASALGVSEELFAVAQGQIPTRLRRILCYDNPHETLSVLTRLAVRQSKNIDNDIEELSRSVLFRYYNIVGKEFGYPVDIRDLLRRVYGLEVQEESFSRLELGRTIGEFCGLFIPGYTRMGERHFSNVVLLNKDVLAKYSSGPEIGRFTLAHEAFHKEMWDSREILSSNRKNVVFCRIKHVEHNEEQKAERQANHFAGALLMPAKSLRAALDKYPKPFDLKQHGEELRSLYGVTISALRVRLQRLRVGIITT